MSDPAAREPTVTTLLSTAESLLPEPGAPVEESEIRRIAGLLRDAERATPGGAALHAQLDTVVKWVELLGRPDEHARFGGPARVHDHVRLQIRLAFAAAADYLRATG